MKRTLVALTTFCLLAVFLAPAARGDGAFAGFDVKKFGAVGDGQAMDTAAVQKTIDACSEDGGGTVYFPPGVYLTGSLHLRSHVYLYLDAGATIRGSKEDSDYDPYEELGFKNDSDHETSFFHSALIWGEDIERIGIIGEGTVDGNREKRGGPKPIALKRCKHVDIKGIHIVNSPNYAISMLGADYVNIDGVTIRDSHCDGIDPDCCKHVRISNCHIETWDDAIVPKASFSLGEVRATEYLTVTNCILASGCNCFKLGTESRGDFKRITLSNCVMYRTPKYRGPISGIAIESVDRCNIDGIAISNVSMVGIQTPIFLRLGNRGRDQETPTPGSLRNVTISNVVARSATLSSSITGIPGHYVEDVALSDIRMIYLGGGTAATAEREVPENIKNYPEAWMFGPLPSYGLYCRHVDGLKLRNIEVAYEGQDERYAFICDDVKNLEVESFTSMAPADGLPLMKFVNVQDAFLRGCVAPTGTDVFLQCLGDQTKAVTLFGNDLSRANASLLLGGDVNEGEVTAAANITTE